VTLALVESARLGWSSPFVLAGAVGGAVALACFVMVERRARAPMVPPELFRSRTFTGANLLTLLLYAALSGVMFFLPFNLIDVQGYGAAAAGAVFVPFIVLMFTLSRWSGGLVKHYGAKLPLIIGPFVAALGLALFIVAGIGGSYWKTFFPAIVVLGLGMAVSVAPLTTTVMGSVAQDRAGVASGINNAVSRTAGLLAVAAFGIVIVQAFNSDLDGRLNKMDVTPEARRSIDEQRVKLAGAEIPDNLNSESKAALKRMIADSFVYGFRLIMTISVCLALLSTFVSWMMIDGKQSDLSPGKQLTQV
jgi:hypothetical protein